MLAPEELINQLHWRYAVKAFDPERKIDSETWFALEQSLVLSPSSFGLQPWRFVVITDPTTKSKLPAISWGQSQPKDCSHMVVLAARKHLDESYVDQYIDSIAKARGVSPENLGGYRSVILGSLKSNPNEIFNWNSRQVYIALGQLMTAAAVLGIDACPMEGLDMDAYNKLLGFESGDYKIVVGCAVGYRHAEDKYAQAKKVRFPTTQVVERID